MQRIPAIALCAAIALGSAAPVSADYLTAVPPPPPPSLAAQVGKAIFFDSSLSASGRISCASCHDPNHAYGPPNDLAVQLGGPSLSDAGTRAVPSLRYQEYTPAYADVADNPDGISPAGPGGGFTLDGRASSLSKQAQIPLLAPNEMANKSPAEVARKLQRAPYAELFRTAFGKNIFASPAAAFRCALEALQAFQLEDDSFHPYTSKFDLYQNNKIGGDLTEAERRGLQVYEDPKKGNCFACHYGGPGIRGSVGLFTDFTYAAIGVPRNGDIPTNRDPKHFDMGICGRADHPLPASARFCGMFKVPTLRNVATRQVFFHNGRMKSLYEVLRFYNTRDTQPELWYPVENGVVQKFDDLPPQYRGNIDPQAPLDGRPRGAEAPMSDQDLRDLQAFLKTLTDGYVPPPARNAAALGSKP